MSFTVKWLPSHYSTWLVKYHRDDYSRFLHLYAEGSGRAIGAFLRLPWLWSFTVYSIRLFSSFRRRDRCLHSLFIVGLRVTEGSLLDLKPWGLSKSKLWMVAVKLTSRFDQIPQECCGTVPLHTWADIYSHPGILWVLNVAPSRGSAHWSVLTVFRSSHLISLGKQDYSQTALYVSLLINCLERVVGNSCGGLRGHSSAVLSQLQWSSQRLTIKLYSCLNMSCHLSVASQWFFDFLLKFTSLYQIGLSLYVWIPALTIHKRSPFINCHECV